MELENGVQAGAGPAVTDEGAVVVGRGEAVASGRGDAAVASAHGGAVTPSGAPAGAVPEAEQVSDGMLRAAMARAVKAALASGRDEARRQSDAARAREDEQARRDMEAAFPAVLERVSAIVGKDFERGAFRDRMYAWLRAQGVPDEAVAGIRHGWELEIAAKAMLYDGMADARRRAAAKVADAPAVLAPRGRSEQDGADRLRRARAALNKHPNSTEALAELFAAL